MVRNKIISISVAMLLAINSLWDASPVFYESNVVDAKAATTETAKTEKKIVVDSENVDASSYGLCDRSQDGVILHAFCWSFNAIKENMKDIAEAGFTTVQTSPINQCLEGEGGGMDLMGNGKWYYHYQPTDWKIGNYQLGSREEYIAMCDEADKYGVKIISDVLPNHTTPTLNAVSKDLINAAGGDLYHANGFNEISKWTDRYECTTGQMGGLPDVNTENKGFQEYYLKFCNDVIACGGDGFRYDTAKHIGVPSDPKDAKSPENDFWPVASGQKAVNGVKLSNPDKLFIYGEILMDQGIPYEEYGRYINMTNSGYGGKLRGIIGGKNLSAGNLSDWGHPIPDRTVTWVESHDTYCNEGESVWMSNQQIRACWAIITARKQGTPLFMSRPMGSTNTKDGRWGNNKIGARGNDEFKHPEVAAVNHFRNAMVGEGEYMSNFGGESCLVIERGTKGVVIINTGSDVSNVKLNKVADGTYTEEVSGKEVQVSGGTLNYTVPGGTIAVVYNAEPIVKSPTVSASKASGDFQEPFTLTLTANNATKATYCVDGGEAVEFTGKATVKIGEGASIGDKITVKVTAEGEGDPFSQTFTYTMTETPAYKMYLRVKKSDFDTAPTAYLYDSAEKALNGAWPGTAMKAEGEYYVFTSDAFDSATVILVSGDWRSTPDMAPGLSVKGCMEYDKASNKFTAFTPSSGGGSSSKATATPKVTTTPKATATPKPEVTEPPKTTELPKPTATPKVTETPKITVTPPADKEDTGISVSKQSGSSFNTETMDVKITLDGADSGTYILDGGPKKSFQSGDKVTIGQGMIADSEVILEVNATINGKNVSETFIYNKVFDASTANVKTSALTKIQSLFEVVAEAASVDAAAESDAYYATNPNGVGKEATVTGMSGFTQDMLVARCGAWDVPNAFHGAHENSVADCYGLYAAWDDTNLYIGLEMVNTTDTWHDPGDGPLLEGGKMSDVPVVIAINTGKGNKMTGKCPSDKQGHIWQCNLEFETRIDHLLFGSAKGTGNPGLFTADENGDSDYAEHLVGFKDAGITYVAEDGSISPEIMQIVAPGDDVSEVHDTAKYKDAMGMGHDRKYDTFFTYTIPLKALNIDKAYIESNGIGIMGLGTRQTSPLDCIPHDPSMLDNTFEDYTIAQDNTSHEKEDLDIITVPLAAVGNAKGGGEGGNSSVTTPTKKPDVKETETPDDGDTVTATPKITDEPEITATPKVTDEPEITATPKATEKATTEPKETEVPKESPEPDIFTVNFGADRSSPQLSDTELLLSGIAYGGEKGAKGYKYTFYVDGIEVMEAFGESAYVWTPEAGNHKIKVVVEDNKGNKISSEKAYVIEAISNSDSKEDEDKTEDKDTVTNKPIITEKPTATPKITEKPTITKEPTITNKPETGRQDLKVRMSASKKSPRKAGTKIKLTVNATGGTAPYTYIITVKNGKKVTTLLSSKTKNSVNWNPTKAGTYVVQGNVLDADGDIVSTTGKYTVSSPISVKSFKLSKTTMKKGNTLKMSAKATSISKVKYQFKVVKAGAKKATALMKYSTKSTYKWKAKKKGKYYIYLQVKDTKGNIKTVKKIVKVK